jgi:hypothetical protein
MPIRVTAGSLSTVFRAIDTSLASEKTAARLALDAAGRVLHAESRANIGLRDHSLAQLAALDHPYARRHGSIQSSKLGHAGWLVHSQSGDLLNALKHAPGTTPRGAPAYSVWFDVAQAPHAAFVVRGTRTMLGRDVLWETAQDAGTKKEMMRAIVTVLGKQLRTKSTVRFGTSGGPRRPSTRV